MDGSPVQSLPANPVGMTPSNQPRQLTQGLRDSVDRLRSKGRPTNNPYDAGQDHFADAGMSTKSLSSIGGSSSSNSRSPSQQSLDSADLGVIYSSDSASSGSSHRQSARRDRSRGGSRQRNPVYYTGNYVDFSSSMGSFSSSPECVAEQQQSIIRVEMLPKQQIRTKAAVSRRSSTMSQHGMNILLSKDNSEQVKK